MLTKVDNQNSHTVFKVTNQKGLLVCYRVFPDTGIGDASTGREFKSLAAARKTLAGDVFAPVEEKKSKSRKNGKKAS